MFIVYSLGFRGSVVLYCNFRSLASLGLLGFLIRQLKVKFIAILLSAAKEGYVVTGLGVRVFSRVALTKPTRESWRPPNKQELAHERQCAGLSGACRH